MLKDRSAARRILAAPTRFFSLAKARRPIAFRRGVFFFLEAIEKFGAGLGARKKAGRPVGAARPESCGSAAGFRRCSSRLEANDWRLR